MSRRYQLTAYNSMKIVKPGMPKVSNTNKIKMAPRKSKPKTNKNIA